MTKRVLIVIAALVVAGALPTYAVGYKDTVVAPKGWSDGLERVAVFVTRANTVVNASEVESQVESKLAASTKLPFRVVMGTRKAEQMMALGLDSYDDSRRQEILEALQASAVLLVDIAHSAHAEATVKGAEVHVIVRVVAADGKIRMRGESSGQAWNTLSAPENIARHSTLRLIGKATGLNLD